MTETKTKRVRTKKRPTADDIDIEAEALLFVNAWEDTHRATRRIDGPLDKFAKQDLVKRIIKVFEGAKALGVKLKAANNIQIPPIRKRK